MQKLLPFLIFSVFFLETLNAQYVNTDSLVIVPGEPYPLMILQADSIAKQIRMNNPSFLSRFLVPGNQGYIISQFGPRSGRMHYGTDIKMAKGDTVIAVMDGTVSRANYGYGFGNLVVVQHENNIQTYYAHLSKFLVKTGSWVKKGEPIGLAGSTGRARGPHLHFEIHENDQAFDPEMIFDFEKQQIRKDANDLNTLVALHRRLKPQGYANNVAVPEYYKVRSGDSLWVISRRFRTPLYALCSLNNLTERSVLQIGQVLKLY